MTAPDPGQPWGLSGPHFALLMWVALGVAALLMFVVRLVLDRRVASADPGAVLTECHEIALLAGGTGRLTQVVLAELISQERVRIDRRGRLSPLAGQGLLALENEMFRTVERTRNARAHHVAARVADSYGHHRLQLQLERRGLLRTSEQRLRAAALVLAPVFVVVGVVVARLIEGAAHERPVGQLTAQLILAVVIGRLGCSGEEAFHRSARGRAMVRALRATQSPDAPATDAVALYGASALRSRDRELARALSLRGGRTKHRGGGGCGGGGCGGGCGG